jgi:TPR repeat protein
MSFRIAIICLAAAAVMGLPLPAAAAEDYEVGVRAYSEGDFAIAIEAFSPLLERGHAGAETMIGVMYLNGQGYPQNYGLAAVWLYKAARKGEAGAQLVLGSQHLFGWGVERDLVRAYVWLKLAARGGLPDVSEQAMSYRQQAALAMTPREIERAERLAARWSPVTDRFTTE